MSQTKQYLQRSVNRHRQPHSRASDLGFCLTIEGIEQFLDLCRAEGRVEGTIEWYRRGLKHLYEDLPEDKIIRHGTLERWRKNLIQQGYATGTINSFLSVSNSYLDFVGHREYQLIGQMEVGDDLQPELTRTEYLRLLQTARVLGKEKVYLLIKLFGSTSLTVQELPQVPEEKGNPRCLKRLCQTIRSGIEDSISLLVEQAMDRMLEQEQLETGWEER